MAISTPPIRTDQSAGAVAALRSWIRRRPFRVSRSSTSSIVSVKGTIAEARPPVARKRGLAQLVFDPPRDAVDQPGEAEDEAGAGSRPGWSGRSPSRGSPRSMRGIRAARSISAVSEISRPGPIAPPRYSPSAETASKLIPVPKSTTTQALAEAVVGGDRVDQAVGADLERVVDPDRHPGLHAGPDQQALGRRGSARSAARTGRRAAAPPRRRRPRRGRRGSCRGGRGGRRSARPARRRSRRRGSGSASARPARSPSKAPRWVWVLPTSTARSIGRLSPDGRGGRERHCA